MLVSTAHVGALHVAMGMELGFLVFFVDVGVFDVVMFSGIFIGGFELVVVEEYDFVLIVYMFGMIGLFKGVMVLWG